EWRVRRLLHRNGLRYRVDYRIEWSRLVTCLRHLFRPVLCRRSRNPPGCRHCKVPPHTLSEPIGQPERHLRSRAPGGFGQRNWTHTPDRTWLCFPTIRIRRLCTSCSASCPVSIRLSAQQTLVHSRPILLSASPNR